MDFLKKLLETINEFFGIFLYYFKGVKKKLRTPGPNPLYLFPLKKLFFIYFFKQTAGGVFSHATSNNQLPMRRHSLEIINNNETLWQIFICESWC